MAGREIYVKREDLIHPMLSGNKFRKLKYNLEQIARVGTKTVVSFGGAYSNHIHALAFACQVYEIKLHLFIRGDEVDNPTIRFVHSCGAKCHFVPRTEYRVLKERTQFSEWPGAAILPEGGSNPLAILGIQEMMKEIKVLGAQYCVSYGSGGTSIGMMSALKENESLHVFSSLKFPDFESTFTKKCLTWKLTPKANTHLYSNYHFGGYAKWTSELINFINSFPLKLDPIYTGKLFFAVKDLITQGILEKERPIIVIHTGGLQGRDGFNERFNNILS